MQGTKRKGEEGKGKYGNQRGQTGNKKQDDRLKLDHINNHITFNNSKFDIKR